MEKHLQRPLTEVKFWVSVVGGAGSALGGMMVLVPGDSGFTGFMCQELRAGVAEREREANSPHPPSETDLQQGQKIVLAF